MFKNNLKIAWRNLVKDRQFTLLNLVGLSTGLACALLIYLWVNDELHVDKFNAKDSQLYQVLKKSTDGSGAIQIDKHTQGLLAQSMAQELPEVEYAVPVVKFGDLSIVSFENKHIKVQHEFAGKDFFNVFSYPLINGSNNQVSGVSGVFISDQLALKLFNTIDVLGKTVNWDYKDDNDNNFGGPFTISGVYKAPPSNATNHFDLLLPFDLYAKKKAGGRGDVTFWGSNMASTYIILKKGTDIGAFNNKIENFSKEKIKSLYGSRKDLSEYEGTLFMRRFSDAYLYNNYVNGVQSGGRIEYVKLFSIIAIFILVIACINFMNLSTAKASRRLKEIGIKKVVGATRASLVFQYMTESLLMSFLSLIIATAIIILLLPTFNQITSKQIDIHFSTNLILSILTITLLAGLIAGSYPALYLSGFNAATVLKGKLKTSVSELLIRKGLVVFQFALSAIFIVAVIVVYKQMDLVQTKNLGYTKDNIIHFSNEGNLHNGLELFFAEVKKLPGVINASSMEGDLLGNPGHSGGGIDWEKKDPNLKIEYYGIGVDYNMMEMLGIKMKEGRSFSNAFGSDSLKVIFNESAIAAMGLKAPIGKTVSLWGQKKQIIGIAKDFHFESLYKKVAPFFFYYGANNPNVAIKIKAGKEKETLAGIENLYKKFNQGLPFEFKFLDEDYQALYASEQRVAVLSRYFACIAIIISCLGLFGLAAFTTQKRQKEIGIRKIVGASVSNVVVMLSSDFLKLVAIAVLIAFPISWWAMTKWLEGFAYRVNVGAGIFLLAGASIIIITLLTISFQSVKAAITNPVKSLRTE